MSDMEKILESINAMSSKLTAIHEGVLESNNLLGQLVTLKNTEMEMAKQVMGNMGFDEKPVDDEE